MKVHKASFAAYKNVSFFSSLKQELSSKLFLHINRCFLPTLLLLAFRFKVLYKRFDSFISLTYVKY